MHDNLNNPVWLIGAGSMALDYVKVLTDLKINFIIIGRSEFSAKKLHELTGKDVISGGVKKALETLNHPKYAIVATGVEQLASVTLELLNAGIKKILVEKPGGFYNEIELLSKTANEKNAQVYIAYNRRYYASTLKAMEIIKDDGGPTSFHFEFTEWAHTITPLQKAEGVKEQWLFGNSSHVIDLAFFLGGKPKHMSSFVKGSIEWHPSASSFSGAGISEQDAPFSYHANWSSPGRWSVEILTAKHRLIFRPMEKLQIQHIGSVTLEDVSIDYAIDEKFKPGLYEQVKSFIYNNNLLLPDIHQQQQNVSYYKQINFGTSF